MNVLFSSVGRRVELVRAFRASLGTTDSLLVGADVNWLAPGLQVVDVRHQVPRCNDEAFPTAIRDICQQYKIDVVLPLIDTEIPYLNQHRELIESTGAKLAVCHGDAVDMAADKWLTHHFFQRLGLQTPQSWLPNQIADIPDSQFPLFIKPRCGSASANTFRVRNRTELEFFAEYVPNAIIQEMIVGDEITTDIICDFDSNPLAIVSRKRIEVRGGEAMKSVTIYDEEITQSCSQIAKALPATGPVTAQCIVRDGQPYFIEINARLGGGLPLAVAAGVDVPQLIQQAVNPSAVVPTLANYKTGVFMTRCDESFFVEEALHEQHVCSRV